MITRSFIFLDKISKKSETNIWKQKITDWNDFLKKGTIKGISDKRKMFYNSQLMKAKNALVNYDSSFFVSLPTTETWRLYHFFKDDAVFLDLEMCGERDITVITLFNGIETKTLVRNINLFPDVVKEELKKYKLMITFNGSSCDLPIIKRYLGNIIPTIPHIDLRHCCKRLNLEGGLKNIEKQLGIERPQYLRGGSENPYWLWKAFHASGDQDYLTTLIEYNEEDTINLKPLMEFCYKELKNKLLAK